MLEYSRITVVIIPGWRRSACWKRAKKWNEALLSLPVSVCLSLFCSVCLLFSFRGEIDKCKSIKERDTLPRRKLICYDGSNFHYMLLESGIKWKLTMHFIQIIVFLVFFLSFFLEISTDLLSACKICINKSECHFLRVSYWNEKGAWRKLSVCFFFSSSFFREKIEEKAIMLNKDPE